MNLNETLDELLAAGLLEEEAGQPDGALRLTAAFAEDVDAERARADETPPMEYAESLALGPGATARLGRLTDPDTSFLGVFGAVGSRTDLGFEELLTASVVLAYVERGMPPAHGSPSSFLPVDGDQLRTLVELLDRAFVYVWRDDCDPCRVMKAELDDIFETGADDIALLSVHGQDCPALLDREFDVPGAPALLSVVDGEVDARMYGPQYGSVIEREFDTLRTVGAE
jgi:hypothetical protein